MVRLRLQRYDDRPPRGIDDRILSMESMGIGRSIGITTDTDNPFYSVPHPPRPKLPHLLQPPLLDQLLPQ